jgi:hypothetical protein
LTSDWSGTIAKVRAPAADGCAAVLAAVEVVGAATADGCAAAAVGLAATLDVPAGALVGAAVGAVAAAAGLVGAAVGGTDVAVGVGVAQATARTEDSAMPRNRLLGRKT